MANYKTPGVYVEEIALFPPTIVRVATAIPAFVGYTEKALQNGVSVLDTPVKIKSLLDYQQIFGGEATDPDYRGITVNIDSNGSVSEVEYTLKYLLYQSLRHFYANGGGDAYIVSIGGYSSSALDKEAMKEGVDALKKADEPTLILVPDAYGLSTTNLGEVQAYVLAHCNNMQDRFGIFDVKDTGVPGTDMDEFRNRVGNQYLKYGAAYYPNLETTISPDGVINEDSFTLSGVADLEALADEMGDEALIEYYDAEQALGILDDDITVDGDDNSFSLWVTDLRATITEAGTLANIPNAAPGDAKAYLKSFVDRLLGLVDFLYALHKTGAVDTFRTDAVEEAKETLVEVGGPLEGYAERLFAVDRGYAELNSIGVVGTFAALGSIANPAATYADNDYDYNLDAILPATITASVSTNYGAAPASEQVAVQNAILGLESVLDDLESEYGDLLAAVPTVDFEDLTVTSSVYANILQAIRSTGYTLPPCGAMAGVYASVDRDRGVWKAPANVSLNAVSKVAKMLDSTLDDLNMPSNGKAINAIRSFRGQGILVYGARTLAGNDNEWRYIPVRRTFLMVEESVKKATEAFVFEPNDANTWQKLRGMVEAFLIGIWRDGGLAGAVPADAFFVKCGLGSTMTADDILNGKLIIEIGMAVVRPAEFIILRFSHKMQES